jgi:hypothetical protein
VFQDVLYLFDTHKRALPPIIGYDRVLSFRDEAHHFVGVCGSWCFSFITCDGLQVRVSMFTSDKHSKNTWIHILGNFCLS